MRLHPQGVEILVPGRKVRRLHGFGRVGARVVPVTMSSLHPTVRQSDLVDARNEVGGRGSLG